MNAIAFARSYLLKKLESVFLNAFVQDVPTEYTNWVLDKKKRFDQAFWYYFVELIPIVCMKNFIYTTKPKMILWLSPMNEL